MPSHRTRAVALSAALGASVLAAPVLPALRAAAATSSAPVTYAGGGFGDGGPALSAWLSSGWGLPHVAADADGNVYVPDAAAHSVRKVDAETGLIKRFAGTGVQGSTGDGGPATAARLDGPVAVAFEPGGALLVADRAAARVRRIATDGTISTLAGDGTRTLSATPVPAATAAVDPTNVYAAPDGTVYVTEPYGVRKIADGTISRVAGQVATGGLGGDGGPAVDAVLHAPTDVVAGADGVLYVADGNNRVRRVGADGVITTVAGAGSVHFGGDPGDGGPATEAYFSGLTSVSIRAADGAILASDVRSGVRAFVPGGTIDVAAALPCVGAVEQEAAGTFLVACGGEVRRVAADGSADEVVAGTRDAAVGDGLAATGAALYGAAGVAADAAGNLYVAERFGDRVRKVGPDGTISTVAGSVRSEEAVAGGDGGPATDAVLADPVEVAVAPDGTLYVADGTRATVRKVGTDGTITTVAGPDTVGAPLAGPLTLAAYDGGVYVADAGNGRVRHVDTAGTVTTVAGGGSLIGAPAAGQPASSLGLAPSSVARTAAGDVLVVSHGFLYTISGGTVVTALGVGNAATRVAVDHSGRTLVQEFTRISWLKPDGSRDDLHVSGPGFTGPVHWAVLADGRVVHSDHTTAPARVLATTPAWTAALPPQVAGVRVENVATPPVVHWTPPAAWGDAIAIPVLRRGTAAARTPTDGADSANYAAGATSASLPFDEQGGIVYGATYTVSVFSYSPSKRAYSAPVSVTFQPRIPPPSATNLKLAPGVGKATVRWTNPASGITGVVVRMAASTTPPTATSGTVIYSGTGTGVIRTGLAIGRTYSFSVFTRNSIGDHSGPLSGTLTGTTVAMKVSATTVKLKAPVTISGTLRPPGAIFPPDEAVQLLGRRRGTSTWLSLDYYGLDATGTFRFVHRPSFSLEYQVKYPGFGPRLGSYAKKSVAVRTAVTAAASRTSVPLGGSLSLRGTVAPSHARQQVTIQRYYGGAWRGVGYATLTSTSSYAFPLTPGARGTYYYRVVKRADTDHAEGVSPTVKLTVG